MDMIRVPSSELKAKMGQYMRAVQDGEEVVITDRDRPVARLLAFEEPARDSAIQIARPRDPSAPRLGDLEVRGLDYRATDTTAILGEDRGRR